MKTCAEVLAAYKAQVEPDEKLVNEHLEKITERLYELAKYKQIDKRSGKVLDTIYETIGHEHATLTEAVAKEVMSQLLTLGFYVHTLGMEYQHSVHVYKIQVSYNPIITNI